MKMFSFCLDKNRDIDAILTEFHSQCPKNYSAILCTIFSSEDTPEPNHALCKRITEEIPDVKLVGCTSSGEIFEGGVRLNTILINFMVFESSSISIKFFDSEKLQPAEIASKLEEAALNTEDLKGLGFFTTPITVDDLPIFADTLSRLLPDIKIFGGSADFYRDANSGLECRSALFDSTKWIPRGVFAVFFAGKNLNLQLNSFTGWKPLGREMTITGMKNLTTVSTFDNKPAIELYEKYLGIVPEKDFFRPLITFPIIIRRDGHKIARVAYAYDKDGSVHFSGDCRIGDRLHLSYGDPLSMRRHLNTCCADISFFNPQGILIFSCIVRRMYLKQDVNLELAPFAKIAPTAGTYVFGEIRRFDGYTNVHLMNSSLLAVSFREGEKPRNDPRTLPPVDETMDEHLMLISGLAHFVSVTNHELEEANRELRHLANTDRLTNLLNRGAIELILKELLLSLSYQPQKCLGLIMLDLDYFKKVNDTFGHEEGDRVLKEAATVMLSSVRSSDCVGRWGGEEFMIVLRDCDIEKTVQIAEKIRTGIHFIRLPDGSGMTASLGVSTAAPGDTLDGLYTRLDALLYEAKNRGRNRVCSDQDE